MMRAILCIFGILATLLIAGAAPSPAPAAAPVVASAVPGGLEGIEKSPHNLTAMGRGKVRAKSEQELCVFCHTPHNKAGVKGVWNRTASITVYKVYSSSSLKARPGQPTGASKLCLSCHDGTIAVGNVLSKRQVEMVGNKTTLTQGAGLLGTDLSGDHPISFPYDETLARQQPTLRNPHGLPKDIPLDANSELQCTSCHDAHNNKQGSFLVMDNTHSQLCNACHNPGTTVVLGHTDCASCHQSHAAPSGPHLLKAAKVADTCLTCHNGRTGPGFGKNIAADISKIYHHDTASPTDQANHIPNNSTCSDCHEPHTIVAGRATAPNIPPTLGTVGGVNASGASIAKARFEYEVCFKCHGDQPAQTQAIGRQFLQLSRRQQFDRAAVSSHPVEVAGHNSDVPSLAPGYTVSSIIYCADCHNSDASPAAGGTGPSGVHGSSNRGLLALQYNTADETVESASAYALCYKCHQRNTLLTDPTLTPNQPFPLHFSHVIKDKASCSLCHDSHGMSSSQVSVRNGQHLINFDTTIVRPDPVTGKLEYASTAARSGTCTLMCHGVAHSPLGYGTSAAAMRRMPHRPAAEANGQKGAPTGAGHH